MDKFKDFIFEEKVQRDKITILILTNSKSKKPEVVTGKLLKAAESLGLPCYPVVVSEAWVADNDIEQGTIKIKNHDGKENEVEIEARETVVFVRAGALDNETGLALLGTLQNAGCFMINDRDGMLTCDNKMSAYTAFERNGINTPRTSLVNNEKSIPDAHERIGGQFPVIIKTLTGTQGVGVSKVDSMESLMSVIQSLWKFGATLIVQEFLKLDGDIRTIVLNGRIVASTKRIKPKKDFRSNRHMGAETEPYVLSDEEKKIVLAAARATGSYMVGVDHAVVNKKIFILECNGSPGLGSNFQNYYITQIPQEPIKDKNILKFVLEYLQNPVHRRHKFNQESGYHETLEIVGYGDIRAKFDTGNYKYPVIHAENIEVTGKKITFTHGDKTITTNLVGDYVSITGGGEDKRYLVDLDFEFAGSSYGKITFGLDNRDDFNTDVLLNRKTMRMLNVMINPQRKYVVTTKYVLDK